MQNPSPPSSPPASGSSYVTFAVIAGWLSRGPRLVACVDRSGAGEAQRAVPPPRPSSPARSRRSRSGSPRPRRPMASSRRSRPSSQATSGLNERLAVLGEREKDAAAVETTVKERKAALRGARGADGDAGSKLNRRLAALGEREREQVEHRPLAQRPCAASRRRARRSWRRSRAGSTSGCKVLGERERALAEYENKGARRPTRSSSCSRRRRAWSRS